MKRTAIVLAIVAVIMLSAAAHAEILFTTGAPQASNGGWFGWGSYYNSDTSNNILARPFTIGGTGGTLEGVRFWAMFVAPSYPVYLDLYEATANGAPTHLMHSWYLTEADIAAGALYHVDEPGLPTDGYKVGWTLPTPVDLAGDATYSFAIYGAGQPGGSPRPIYWLVNTSPSVDSGPLSYVTTNAGTSWTQFDPGSVGLGDQFGRNALELIGTRTPIPEPGTIMLFSLGVIPALVVIRRKK